MVLCVVSHSGLSRVQGKFSFLMAVRVDQQDAEALLTGLWHTRMKSSEREEGSSVAD